MSLECVITHQDYNSPGVSENKAEGTENTFVVSVLGQLEEEEEEEQRTHTF